MLTFVLVLCPNYMLSCRSVLCCDQAWLTEIHEYAQQDVVLMLLGNKASQPDKPLEATSTLDMQKILLAQIHLSAL